MLLPNYKGTMLIILFQTMSDDPESNMAVAASQTWKLVKKISKK